MTDPEVSDGAGASFEPPAPAEPAARRGVAILLAAAALVAAVIGGRVAFRSFTATSLWQQSVREETKRAAAYVETLRYLYTSEQPLAFALSEARFRSEEMAKIVPTLSVTDRPAVELEQFLQNYLSSGQLAEASPSSTTQSTGARRVSTSAAGSPTS